MTQLRNFLSAKITTFTILQVTCTCRAVSGYFGNGARAFEIGKNSVVLDKIGKNFNKLKKNQCFHLQSGMYLENGLAHQVQNKKWAGGCLRPPLGPGQRPGRGSEKIWVFKHLNGNFLLNPDTYFSPKMARNTLRNILEFFFLMKSQILFVFQIRIT